MSIEPLLRLLQRRRAVKRKLVDHALDEHRSAARRDLSDDEAAEALRRSVRLKERRARWLVRCEAAGNVGAAASAFAATALAVAGVLELLAR